MVARLVDTHTHVNFQPFATDAKEVIERALAAGVWLNNVGTQRQSSARSVELAEQYNQGVYASVGLHPLHLFQDLVEEQPLGDQIQQIRAHAEQFDYSWYRALAQSSNKVVAIGECGLDYYHFERANLQAYRAELTALQHDTLKQHCQLALELNLPVVIHCRDAAVHTTATVQAFNDLLAILQEYQGKLRGVIHCYTGPVSLVQKFLDLGFYIGFTGIVTFAAAKEVQAAVRAIPLERLLLETDAPYLTPEPHRGKRNQPEYVQFVAEAVAKLQGKNIEEVAKQTSANAFELFRFS